MPLVLKRIVWPDGRSRPDDFNIMHDGEEVGRIYRMNGVGLDRRWTHFWYTRQPNGGDARGCQGSIPRRMGGATVGAALRGAYC
jgi:hypothetical protein